MELQTTAKAAAARRALAKKARDAGAEIKGLDGSPAYEGWTVVVEEIAKKPKGAPRGKSAIRDYTAKAIRDDARGAAQGGGGRVADESPQFELQA
eukprot:1147829-Prymnesium_polylepis.1